MKDEKQKAEFNLYIYILDFLIGDGDDISILKIDQNFSGNAPILHSPVTDHGNVQSQVMILDNI